MRKVKNVATSIFDDNNDDDDDDDDSSNSDEQFNYGAHENFKGKDKATHDLSSDKRSYSELKIVA